MGVVSNSEVSKNTSCHLKVHEYPLMDLHLIHGGVDIPYSLSFQAGYPVMD